MKPAADRSAGNGLEARPGDAGVLRLSGELRLGNVAAVLRQSRNWFARDGIRELDLAGIRRCDSAGIALLLAWSRAARAQRRELRLLNPPAQLRTLIAFYGLDGQLSA